MKLSEGESGLKAGHLTQERIEALAEYWGKPESERTEAVIDFGRTWGLTAAKVRDAKLDKRVTSKIREALENQLLYDVIESRAIMARIMKNEKEKADTKAKIWRTQEQMAGNLTSGPGVQVFNDNRSGEFTELSVPEIKQRLKQIRDGDLSE